MKNKIVAGILALFLGGFGIDKFYLDKPGYGVTILLLNLFLFWTLIVPAVIGIVTLIQGIGYMTTSDEEFNLKYNK